MQFNLNHTPTAPGFKINHDSRVFLIGSCFSENIGKYFESLRFKSISNPSGILFNPASIANCLQSVITGQAANPEFIINRDSVFYSLVHHSNIHESTAESLRNRIENINKKAADFLKTADFLIITFGSAFVYRHKQLNKTVANCHKLPADNFDKKLLRVDQIVKNYSTIIEQLQLYNPGLKLIFTVSPVKYLRDGLVENNISKATLLLSVNEIVQKFRNCFYFPAYELITDDLRDYRFYKEDMAHPNEQAIQYVWEKFSDCFFNEQTKTLNTKIHKLNMALAHRIMSAGELEGKKLSEFIENQKTEIRRLHPGIELEAK